MANSKQVISKYFKRSNFVIFRPRQKKLPYQVNLKVFDHLSNSYVSLECKNNVKYLVVLIDEKLSRKHHISHIASKISMSIGIIARHFVPLHTLHHIYRSLNMQPYLLYGIVAWGRAGKTYRTKILRLQKRALRLIFFGDYKSLAVPFFISSNLLPLDLLYFKSVAILMYDFFNNLSPPQVTNIFNFQSNINPYNTRSSSRGNFSVQYSRVEKQSPFHGTVLQSGTAYQLKCVTHPKRILNPKFIKIFGSRRLQ